MIYLGKTVRRFRDSLGLSQSEFAERIGVTNDRDDNSEDGGLK